MSRDLSDSDYYVSQGGKIPVKWTAPEVNCALNISKHSTSMHLYRHFTTKSTPQPVMCGALVCSCMRYGVWDTNHLKEK